VCRNGTLSKLQSIQLGKLAIYEASAGKGSAVFGVEREGRSTAVLNVHDEKFWVRLALFADMVRTPSIAVIGFTSAFVRARN
jgi:cyclopropane-fatty-acyl-phospholipid synthase